MRLQIDATLAYTLPAPADVLLSLEAITMGDQQVVSDLLTVSGVGPLTPIPGEESLGRRTWMQGNGPFLATYTATVDVNRAPPELAGKPAAPRAAVPGLVVPYLWPSRYCEADRFEAFVRREFSGSRGGDQVQAMADWIFDHVDYRAGTSDADTTAADTFVQRCGVCRDFAHLMTSFSRAAGIPARAVSAYALDLRPQDFHAVVEVWLEDGWHIVDATRLARPEGIVRIAVGRDATDISFMTIFGTAELQSQQVTVARID